MPVYPPIHIISVNMCKRNTVTHALLNNIINTHLILIQEPWFDAISTTRKNDARDGVDILSGAASLAWNILYPGFNNIKRPHIMAYA